jgi:Na+-translocating ferredoxin:NAD+ oxidoreductase RnfG subunit
MKNMILIVLLSLWLSTINIYAENAHMREDTSRVALFDDELSGIKKVDDKKINETRKKERISSILLAKKLGESVYKVLVEKAKEGDGRAVEAISIMERTEALKIYNISMIVPEYLAFCKKHDKEVYESMHSSFSRYTVLFEDLIEYGNKVMRQGVKSDLIPGANLTPEELADNLEGETSKLKERMSREDEASKLIEECGKMTLVLDAFSDMYE